jgi:hypothetical protein
MTRSPKAVGLSLIALLVVAGGAASITYAATSANKGAFACVTPKRVLALASHDDSCPRGDSKVTLGKQGRRGKTGPSKSYVDNVETATQLPGSGKLLNLKLPKGSYLLNASTTLQNMTNSTLSASCFFQTGSERSVRYNTPLEAQAGSPPYTTPGVVSLAWSSAANLKSTKTVFVVCAGGVSNGVFASGSFTAQVTRSIKASGDTAPLH